MLLKATTELNKETKRLWLIHPSARFRDLIVSEAPLWNLNIQHFPDLSESISRDQLNDPETAAQRLHILQQLADQKETVKIITLSSTSLEFAVPNKNNLNSHALQLSVGSEIEIESLETKFSHYHYQKVPQVHERGQWAIRGGIIDIFGWQSLHPVRIELFDIEIESIREFDIHSQTSRRRLKQVDIILSDPEPNAKLKDFVDKDDIVISYGEDPHPLAQLHFSTGPRVNHLDEQDFSTAAQSTPLPQFSAGDFVMQENQRKLFTEQIESWNADSWTIYLFYASDGEKQRFNELLGDNFSKKYSIQFIAGSLQSGICIPAIKTVLLSSSQLFGRSAINSRGNSQLNHQRRAQAQTDLEDIQGGDLVVHSEYGVGRFKEIAINAEGLEEIHIRFRDNVILSVPIDHSHLLSRYVGMGGKAPQLSKLGDGKWSKAKDHAEKAILDYAAQLLKVQAERNSRIGDAHPPDGKWMQEFESSFPYQETQGQQESIEDAKADMESNKPMDRLICGDVGFGKTEVAIRAIFKAVSGGKQAAVLVPTTVLAEQHWRNFQERMSHFPIRIELLNRFRSSKEVKNTLKGLADGSVDVVVGTHRLVSDDVSFKRIGLAVIDEEQRFGVKHKEKFKQRFHQVDVLTLSATPIPRTLYLSLMGARDMSTIDTCRIR